MSVAFESPLMMNEKEAFVQEAEKILADAGVGEYKQSTLGLTSEFFDTYPDFAAGTVRCAQLAIEGADVIDSFELGFTVDRDIAVSAAMISDIGKADESLRQVVDKSREGLSWTATDQREIKPHARFGCEKALRAGLFAIAPVIAEHHGAQAEPYGMGIPLTKDQKVARDLDAAADFFEAMHDRINTRSKNLSPSGKLLVCYNNFERFIFNGEDYKDRGHEIASALVTRFAEVLPADVG